MTATILTGGLAGAAIGGAIGGWASAYGAAGDASDQLAGAAIGGIAGFAGAGAGSAVGAAAGTLTEAAGLTCANGLGQIGGFINGAAEGGAFGFANGFVQGGLSTGSLRGALNEGVSGAELGAGIGGVAGALMNACFAAGTPMLLAEQVRLPGGGTAAVVAGSLDAEQIRRGDVLLSGSEFDPSAPLAAKVVEEVFVRAAQILLVHVGGREIRTTAEHEFMVRDKGRVPAAELVPGDLLPSHTGGWTAVEKTVNTGKVEPVYNFRVADYHTYFVGRADWGFSVWVHNAYDKLSAEEQAQTDFFESVDHGVRAQPDYSNLGFPTNAGGTGSAYDELNGQGVYILRDEDQVIRYVGRGDAPARLYAHGLPGSGNEDWFIRLMRR